MKNISYDYELFKRLFIYDPETGLITRLAPRRGYKCGSVAGSYHRDGYIKIIAEKRTFQAHRIAWLLATGEWPDGVIDHLNGNREDNRLCNLRVTDFSGNSKNQIIKKKNTSGCTGIIFLQKSQTWQAQIGNRGKSIYLGRFKCKFEAMAARKSAEHRLGFSQNHGTDMGGIRYE